MTEQTISIPSGASQVIIRNQSTVTPDPVAVPDATYEFVVDENQPPVVNAGTDQSLINPASTTTLTGQAVDSDGTITLLQWSKLSGPNTPVFDTPNALSTKVSGMVVGSYVFRLTATDNNGASVSDDVAVVIADGSTPIGGYTLRYSNGFDTQHDLTDNNGQYGNGKVITTDFVTGPGCFESRPANVSSGIRSEWQSFSDAQNPNEGAIEYDIKRKYIVQNNCHEFQWHPNTSGGGGSPSLWHEDGKLTWYNWKNGINTALASKFYTPDLNVWHHHRIEYKFGSNGYLRMFIDGVKVMEKINTQIGDNSGFYLKLGFNGGFDGNVTEAMKSDILYDNLKIYSKD